MRVLYGLVGVAAGALGLLWVAAGWLAPGGYAQIGASAPQLAHIYSQATYTLVQGVTLLIVALLCAVGHANQVRRATVVTPARPRTCPGCGAAVAAAQHFCGDCGCDMRPV